MKSKASELGYLTEPFQVFHLNDIPKAEILPHYHDFRKLVIILSGRVGYQLEDRQYNLKPGSMVFVEAGKVHRPITAGATTYKRVIIYLSSGFFAKHPGLSFCFEQAAETGKHVISVPPSLQPDLFESAMSAANIECRKSHYSSELQQARLSCLLVAINDMILDQKITLETSEAISDAVADVIGYITEHLTDDLNIGVLSEAVHVSRYYLMRLFKKETGYTIKEYITAKRLFLSGKLIRNGHAIVEAAASSGFNDYSNFYRAFVKKYGCSPESSMEEKPFSNRQMDE